MFLWMSLHLPDISFNAPSFASPKAIQPRILTRFNMPISKHTFRACGAQLVPRCCNGNTDRINKSNICEHWTMVCHRVTTNTQLPYIHDHAGATPPQAGNSVCTCTCVGADCGFGLPLDMSTSYWFIGIHYQLINHLHVIIICCDSTIISLNDCGRHLF